MRRETTNRISFAIEELLPPIVRDSFLFRNAAKAVWGRHIDALADFRTRAPFLDASEYEALYRAHPRVHEDTDNSDSLPRPHHPATSPARRLCDVGCGTGHLLRQIGNASGSFRRLVGVDFVLPAATCRSGNRIQGGDDRDAAVCGPLLRYRRVHPCHRAHSRLPRGDRRVAPHHPATAHHRGAARTGIDLRVQSPFQFLSLPAQLSCAP